MISRLVKNEEDGILKHELLRAIQIAAAVEGLNVSGLEKVAGLSPEEVRAYLRSEGAAFDYERIFEIVRLVNNDVRVELRRRDPSWPESGNDPVTLTDARYVERPGKAKPTPLPDFLQIVYLEFDPLAKSHGMRVTDYVSSGVLRKVVYANEARVLEFYLERQQGHLDGYHYPVPKGPDHGPSGTFTELLASDGVRLPQGPDELYAERRLEEAVRLIVEAIRRHERELFGLA